jgi:toxin YhaV
MLCHDRAKFGRNRFRLFFRYSSTHKIIIYAWVNDSETLRTYGSKKDVYAVFKGMLDDGNPPDDWDELMRVCARSGAASTSEITRRIKQSLTGQE